MKEFFVNYKVSGRSCITITAENEDEAREEFERILCNEEPIHDENYWIDDNVIYDIEWNPEITNIEEK